MDYEKKILDFLSTCTGMVSDVFFELYLIIEDVDIQLQPLAVEFLCQHVFRVKSNDSHVVKNYYTDEQLTRAHQKIKHKFAPVLDTLITSFAKCKESECAFYENIWLIIQSSMFKTKRERAIALFALATHDLIPYRQVGVGLSMPETQYNQLIDELQDPFINDAEYILKLDFDQKTQRASLLVDRLLSLESKEAQTVFMAVILNEVERNIKQEVTSALKNL